MAEPADTGSGPGTPGRPRRRARILVLSVVLLFLVSLGVLAGGGIRLSGNLERVDGVFDSLGERPPVVAAAHGAVNVLVVGTDRDTGPARSAPASGLVGAAGRSDTFMVLHLDADRGAASIVSIPRDTIVDVPGHGRAAIATAFDEGGPRLGVQTVEALTGIRLDHLAVIDWSRVGALVDAVGGIHVDLAADVRDPVSGSMWTVGNNALDGPGALAFVRQTEGLPRGDLDRIARQHAVLAAVMAEALHQEMRRDPLMLYRFLDTLTAHTAIDADWSLPELGALAFSLRNLRSAQISYLTMPVVAADADPAGGLQPDEDTSGSLWSAVAQDRVGEWEATHPGAVTPPAVH